MTCKQALAELIAMVEAGIWLPDLVAQIPDLRTDLTWKSYSGSLDAAKALHEAVLGPDWSISLIFGAAHWDCDVTHYPYRDEDRRPEWDSSADIETCPARAWLLAILRALHSMEPRA